MIKRKFIEFLNTRGGYIYFGVEKDKNRMKQGQFIGLALTDVDKINFLKTIFKEFVLKISPS
jgi:hypothetical protein